MIWSKISNKEITDKEKCAAYKRLNTDLRKDKTLISLSITIYNTHEAHINITGDQLASIPTKPHRQ